MPASDTPILTALVSQRVFSYSLDIESYVSRLDADAIRESDSLVVKVAHELIAEFSDPTQDGGSLRNQVLGRVADKPIYLLTLTSEQSHELFEICPSNLKRVSESNVIAAVRQSDIQQRIDRSGGAGFLKLPPNHHFVTPSGIHTEKFLRVADLMQDLADLDAFSYWLRPYIHNSKAILADNRSITPVILRTLLHLNKSGAFPFDFLPGHVIHEPAAANKIISHLVRGLKDNEKVLCILSAHSSGRYANRLREIFAALGKPDACNLVSLFKFLDADSSTEIPTLFELKDGVNAVGTDQECTLCDKESRTVRIDPHHYYVREREESGVTLKTKHFRARGFIDTYGKIPGVLRLHHTDPHDSRHHAFYIDVISLLQSENFQEKLAVALQSIPKPDLICAPNHAAGQALARFARKTLGVPIICDSSDFKPTPNTLTPQIEQIKKSRNLLVLDDVVISGSRLDKINCALRQSHVEYETFDSVTYLVAVSRMESKNSWDKLKDGLTKMHAWNAKLIAIEEMLLPHWKSKSVCPWCIEENALSKVSRKLGNPPEWLTSRIVTLQSGNELLGKSPLLMLEGAACPTLGAQSPIARTGATALEVLFAVSAALQEMRADPLQQDQLSEDFLTSRVISEQHFTRYTEGLLRAAIVRLVKPYEWGNRTRAINSESLLKFIHEENQKALIGEVALGIYRSSITCQDHAIYIDLLPTEAQPIFKSLLSL